MDRQFTPYSLSHWLVLLTFAVVAALLVRAGQRHSSATAGRRFSRGFAVVIGALYLATLLLASMVPPSLDRSVPLHLSDLVPVVSAYALWTHRSWAFALTYYWGLVLSTQALVSPALTGPDFPHYGFLAFWGTHLLVVWAAIYLTWGLGMRPGWRSYRITIAVTLTWASFTFTFNSIAGTNYGFLNAKSATPSLLDVLGPWPWYLVSVAVLVLGTWALMTWPWVHSGRSRDTEAGGRRLG
jgi:hypothetical integral membrane protein (TIGR02206 family)